MYLRGTGKQSTIFDNLKVQCHTWKIPLLKAISESIQIKEEHEVIKLPNEQLGYLVKNLNS